jgi:hypothetical protein
VKSTLGTRMALRQTPTEEELKPILPMRPASVTMAILGPVPGVRRSAMILGCWRMSHCVSASRV